MQAPRRQPPPNLLVDNVLTTTSSLVDELRQALAEIRSAITEDGTHAG